MSNHATRPGRFQPSLTEAQVMDMRARWADGVGIADLSRAFGMSHAGVGQIVYGRSWKHLPVTTQTAPRKFERPPLVVPSTARRYLTDGEVVVVRERRAAGERVCDIARSLNATQTNILQITSGQTRTRLGGPITKGVRAGHVAQAGPYPGSVGNDGSPVAVAELRAEVACAAELTLSASAVTPPSVGDGQLRAMVILAHGRVDDATVTNLATMTGIPAFAVDLIVRAAAAARAA